jgi:uncharacterized membrane protein (UPF0127 family)
MKISRVQLCRPIFAMRLILLFGACLAVGPGVAQPSGSVLPDPAQEPAAGGRSLFPSPSGRRWREAPDEGERALGSRAQVAGRGTERSLPEQGRAAVSLLDAHGRIRVVQAELALDAATRARGLMFRRQLAPGTGMLFVFPEVQPVQMWMKNTPLSLDLLFFDGSGLLVAVLARCEPLSTRPLGPMLPVRAVLELAAGEAERLALGPGARLVEPELDRLRAQ